MIRHIVLIKFKPDVTDATITRLFAELQEIADQLPGLSGVVSGRSKSPEQIERGYLHGFTVDMESWEVLAAYQVHPLHQKLGAQLVAHAVGGIDGILVLDIEV